MDQARPKQVRVPRDGWTLERQLGFLAELARTRSVKAAARAVGMSRESASRLRERRGSELFGALWDRALDGDPADRDESQTLSFTDGRLMRLLGNHFRRERGDFRAIRAQPRPGGAGHRT